jgi:hypothetical protein
MAPIRSTIAASTMRWGFLAISPVYPQSGTQQEPELRWLRRRRRHPIQPHRDAGDAIPGRLGRHAHGEAPRAEFGKRFDPIRWFCGDDELLRVGGRTYAFSSQWGGDDWLDAMTNLRDAFSDRGIVFTPAR